MEILYKVGSKVDICFVPLLPLCAEYSGGKQGVDRRARYRVHIPLVTLASCWKGTAVDFSQCSLGTSKDIEYHALPPKILRYSDTFSGHMN